MFVQVSIPVACFVLKIQQLELPSFHSPRASSRLWVSKANLARTTVLIPVLSFLTSYQDALSAFDRNVVLLSMPCGVLVVLHVQVRCIC